MENNSKKNPTLDVMFTRFGFFCVAVGIIIGVAIYLFGGKPAEASIDTIPETVASETTECTTTPETEATESVETEEPTVILTEPTETIHIEEPVISEEPSEAPSAPVTDVTIPEVTLEDLEMLACVIYQEAGGDGTCDACRYRVADVVLNRVADSRFPNTLYGVLTAPSQYGRFHWTGIVWPSRAGNPGEKHAVERAYKVAEDVLNGNHSELYGQGYIWQAEFVQGNDGFWCCGHFFGRS